MNRLSPLIARRSTATVPNFHRATAGTAAAHWQDGAFDGADAGKWLEELKLFATGWIGGLIFFGTYLS